MRKANECSIAHDRELTERSRLKKKKCMHNEFARAAAARPEKI